MKILASFILFVILLFSGCSSQKQTVKQGDSNLTTTQSGLRYQDLKAGSGSSPTVGQKVTIELVITDENGNVIEDSYKAKRPVVFVMGKDEAITGLEEGISTMKPGGKRKLFIPPELGFGSRSIKNLPANSNLIMEVELLKVE